MDAETAAGLLFRAGPADGFWLLRRVSGMAAARELVLLGARLYLKDLPFLVDSGYGGAGTSVLVPVKKPPQ